MILFMTKELLKRHISDQVNDMAGQYGIDDMKSKIDAAANDLDSMRQETRSLSGRSVQLESEISKLKREINGMKAVRREKADEAAVRRIVEDELKRRLPDIGSVVSREVEAKGTDAQMERLQMLLQRESRKNAELENIVNSQKSDIKFLTETVASMKANMDRLSAYVVKPVDHSPEQSGKYEDAKEVSAEPMRQYLVFTDDCERNEGFLRKIVEQTKLLRAAIVNMYDSQDVDVYLKLTDKCITKMGQIIDRNQDGGIDPEKVAHDCVKVLKQTVVKAMSQEKLKNVLNEYMAGCHFRKLDWKVGKKLYDDDYEYLEEPILYEDVDKKELDGTILGIRQDTFIIEYMEDDEKYEAIIPGIYCIGKYRN